MLNRKIASAFEYRYSWLVRDQLDLAAMNCAARIFVGEHDFAAFRSLGTEVTTTIRRVISSEWTRDADVLLYRVEANEFSAPHGARDGRGDDRCGTRQAHARENRARFSPDAIGSAAPANAPPGGLYLVEVRY